MKKIQLDRFELLYLLEGSARGSHLRQEIWQRCVDDFYPSMNNSEREFIYTYAKRDLTSLIKHKEEYVQSDFLRFLARFNPTNHYIVVLDGVVDGERIKKRIDDAYKFDGKFWVSFDTSLDAKYILLATNISLKPRWLCNASYCMWHDTCKRYSSNVANVFSVHANVKCYWYINKETEHGANMSHF